MKTTMMRTTEKTSEYVGKVVIFQEHFDEMKKEMFNSTELCTWHAELPGDFSMTTEDRIIVEIDGVNLVVEVEFTFSYMPAYEVKGSYWEPDEWYNEEVVVKSIDRVTAWTSWDEDSDKYEVENIDEIKEYFEGLDLVE